MSPTRRDDYWNSGEVPLLEDILEGGRAMLRGVRGVVIGIAVVLFVAFLVYHSTGIYLLYRIDQNRNQIAVRFRYGRIVDVVPAGVYTSLAPYSTIQPVDVGGKPFVAIDPEVITKDRQRVGLRVTGTVHRPGLEDSEFLVNNWTAYRIFYTQDKALVGEWDREQANLLTRGLMQDLSEQAMKVCVGDREFDKAVIGAAREDLRDCICEQLDNLAAPYGLDIRNVMVPNVIISPEVQKKLDEITNARLATDLARQNEQLAVAEANRTLAAEQGAIRVEQGKIQEKAKQDTITAELTKKAVDAQRQVIESQKANDLLSAQREFEIQKARRLAKQEEAMAELASQITLAEMYQANPAYVALLRAQYMAAAYKNTDKIILPAGVDPILVLSGEGINPIVNAPPPAK